MLTPSLDDACRDFSQILPIVKCYADAFSLILVPLALTLLSVSLALTYLLFPFRCTAMPFNNLLMSRFSS
jgi:hypothetical protein